MEKASRAGVMPRLWRCRGRIGVKERPTKFTRNRTTSSAATWGRRRIGGQRRACRRVRRRRGRTRGLVVEGQQQDERDRAGRRRHQERQPDADEVGQEPAGQRPDRRGQDLRRLDRADGAARVLARRARGGHREAQGADPAEQADPGAQHEELADAGDERGEDHQHDVGQQRPHGHPLLAVAVGEASPDRRQQPGEQRRDADEDARPLRDLLLAVDAELAHVEGKERQHEREAGEDHEHHRRHHELVAAPGLQSRQRSCEQADRREDEPGADARCGPRWRRRSRAGARRPGPLRRGAPAGWRPCATATSRQRTPPLQPVPMALLDRFLHRDRVRHRGRRRSRRQRRDLRRVHEPGEERRAPARASPCRRDPPPRGRCRARRSRC